MMSIDTEILDSAIQNLQVAREEGSVEALMTACLDLLPWTLPYSNQQYEKLLGERDVMKIQRDKLVEAVEGFLSNPNIDTTTTLHNMIKWCKE